MATDNKKNFGNKYQKEYGKKKDFSQKKKDNSNFKPNYSDYSKGFLGKDKDEEDSKPKFSPKKQKKKPVNDDSIDLFAIDIEKEKAKKKFEKGKSHKRYDKWDSDDWN